MSTTNYTLIQNPRGFDNLTYGNILDFLMQIRNTCISILNAHDPENKVEIEAGLTELESRTFLYLDELEAIDWIQYQTITHEIAVGIYFPATGASRSFLTAFENIRVKLNVLLDKINSMQEFDFEKMFKQELLASAADLNYAILCAYRMFAISKDMVMSCLLEYCALRGLEIQEFVQPLLDYYDLHRPRLALFEKYPELVTDIQEKVDPELFATLVQYSSYLEPAEIQQIAEGSLEVDSLFLETLEDRFTALQGECDE